MKSSEKNRWVKISLPVDEQSEESIANFLFELGSAGCHTEKGILHGYFSDKDWRQSKAEKFDRYLRELGKLGFKIQIEKMKVRVFADRDWNAEWKKGYKSVEIGGKILIKPSWEEKVAAADKITIEIDPQMAFGTGTHETTQLILEIMLKQKRDFKRILDIGAGTGILSIAAAKLFSGKIFAFDRDPVAVQTARKNAANNGVGERIYFFCSDRLSLSPKKFDLMLANIDRTALEKMLLDIEGNLSPDGLVIFSGILVEERDQFLFSLSPTALRSRDEATKEEWIGITAGRN
ncbi:MAG: 50S ribosomal protein L11 methyltransferase [Calditrichaeota bacterium]|nr:50S ribosomal protein L11 methyltransferase [Calditrichota bacterium]